MTPAARKWLLAVFVAARTHHSTVAIGVQSAKQSADVVWIHTTGKHPARELDGRNHAVVSKVKLGKEALHIHGIVTPVDGARRFFHPRSIVRCAVRSFRI